MAEDRTARDAVEHVEKPVKAKNTPLTGRMARNT